MHLPFIMACFGDSITRGYVPYLREMSEAKYGLGFFIEDFGINGDKAEDGLRRIRDVLNSSPDVVVLGFGMNDMLCEVPVKSFVGTIEQMLLQFEKAGIRVVLNTVSPCLSRDGVERREVNAYNDALFELGRKYAVLVNDVRLFWNDKADTLKECLWYEGCDWIHPNHVGHRLIAYGSFALARRTFTKIVWQFNGNNAHCNFRCPYCYQPNGFHRGHHFMYDVETWRDAFLKQFRNRRLNFYLSFGEPTLAEAFNDVVRMVESVPHWEMVVLTNLSVDLESVYKRSICKEGRFAIAASFHPTGMTLDSFLHRVRFARKFGVEIPVVYVMYPKQMQAFHDEYFPAFQREHVFVHVRRFRGLYQGIHYPSAYSQDDLHGMARYMDGNAIRYMLKDEVSTDKLSFASCSYLGMSNNGDFWACPDWAGKSLNMGNLFDGSANISTGPIRLGGYFSDGTTDGIANLMETDMDELSGNHIFSYALQTGYGLDGEEIVYPNYNKDFSADPIIVKNIYER